MDLANRRREHDPLKLDLAKVPVHVATDLSPEQVRAYQQQFSRSKTILERDLKELRQCGLMRFDGEKRTGCWRWV